jgi:hypothetical protein
MASASLRSSVATTRPGSRSPPARGVDGLVTELRGTVLDLVDNDVLEGGEHNGALRLDLAELATTHNVAVAVIGPEAA